MIRSDGHFVIYRILVRIPGKFQSNEFYFTDGFIYGLPEHNEYTACGECWQTTNIMGTFNGATAMRDVAKLASAHPQLDWQVERLEVSQNTRTLIDVAHEVEPTEKEVESYFGLKDFDAEGRRRRCGG